jgi:hypothetical protein
MTVFGSVMLVVFVVDDSSEESKVDAFVVYVVYFNEASEKRR